MPESPENPVPQEKPDLAVALTACNNIRTIAGALASVRPLARKIVVVDSGSTDGTIEACREAGAEVIHRNWDGPTIQKQFAIDQCDDHAWILLMDSDESLDETLQRSIREAIESNDEAIKGWAFNRKIIFCGRSLNYMFQPEWRTRLIRRHAGRVAGIGPEGRGGHDRIDVDGRVARLEGVCRHDSWANMREMSLRYIELAERAAEHGDRGGSIFNILASPPAALFKQLIIKRGVMDGWRGWVAAGSVAAGALLKHVFIAQKKKQRAEGNDS